MAALVPAVFGEACLEEVVGEFACLGEAIHAFVDSDVDVVVVLHGVEFVFGDNFWWYEVEWDSHVLGAFHGGV